MWLNAIHANGQVDAQINVHIADIPQVQPFTPRLHPAYKIELQLFLSHREKEAEHIETLLKVACS